MAGRRAEEAVVSPVLDPLVKEAYPQLDTLVQALERLEAQVAESDNPWRKSLCEVKAAEASSQILLMKRSGLH